MHVGRAAPPKEVARYGSVGAAYQRLARVEGGAVGRMRLAPGGMLGRHDAPSRQVVLVLAGAGSVAGADGARREVRAGDLVVFEAGEAHDAEAGPEGLDLLVAEGALPEAEPARA